MSNPTNYGSTTGGTGTDSYQSTTSQGTYGTGTSGSTADTSGLGSSGARPSEGVSGGTGELAQRTQDTIGQIQQKASELTTKLVDRINVDDMTRTLEQQVKEHPARTLLVAVGVGFLLGKATK
jgi:ElaB/YqjD/DUF883 family membrane-anchored ribosome-binding protein